MTAGKHLGPEADAKLVAMYQDGASCAEIAEALSISESHTDRLRRMLGLPRWRNAQDDRDDEFIQLYGEGKSPQQIANAMGLSPKSITGIRRRLDLPPFPRSSYKINHENFLDLYAKGLKCREIASELGVNESSVRKLRTRLDLPPWPRPERKQRGGQKRKTIIDRELIRMLTEQGMGSRKIAEVVGCSDKSVVRIRRELGISKTEGHPGYPPETKAAAKAMLEGGASYEEVGRTLKVPSDRIRRWYPGMGWTTQQTAEYRWMLKQLEKLDTPADRRIYSNL